MEGFREGHEAGKGLTWRMGLGNYVSAGKGPWYREDEAGGCRILNFGFFRSRDDTP